MSALSIPVIAWAPYRVRTPRGAPAVIKTRSLRLLAWVRRSLPDLLGDLIQVPARWVLKGRELFVALELLEPQLLADGQNVPVVYPSRNRPGDRPGVRKRSCLVPFAYRNLEWIALEVDNAGHELGLDSRDIETSGRFGRDREIQLPVLVAHCRRARAGIVEEGVARRLLRTSREVRGLVDAIERRSHDAGILAGLDLLLQSVTLGPAGNADQGGQPVERGEDLLLEGSGPDDARPADDQRRAHAAFPRVHLRAFERRGTAVGEGEDLGAIVGGEHHNGVVGLSHLLDFLKDVPDIVVHLLHAGFVDAPVLAAGLAHHRHVLVRQHGRDVHARRVVPDEERLVGPTRIVAVEEVDDLGRNLLVHTLRTLEGQRPLVLTGLVLG